jgi:peptidoglycan/LPS O-acetylase OafA/YrhL
MTKKINSSNIKPLNILRFIGAFLVVVIHYGQEVTPYNWDVINRIIIGGDVVISFFFFLSGAVLAFNYLPKPTLNKKSFFLKRIARVYPNHLIALFATIILGMIFNNAYPRGSSVILQLLSLQAWIPSESTAINYPAWTICVEIFFYILFPFVLLLFKKWSNKKINIVVASIWIVSIILKVFFTEYFTYTQGSLMDNFIQYFPLWHLNAFLVGILCAKYILKVRQENKVVLGRWMYGSGALILVLIVCTDNIIRPYSHNGLLSPLFFLVIAGLAMDQSILTRFLGNKLFLLLGNASYAMYIFQFPMFLLFSAFYPNIGQESLHFNMYLLTLILFSVGIYLYYEARMRNVILNRWLKKEPKVSLNVK